jgi:23S rRNA pseudouridine2605 synthase
MAASRYKPGRVALERALSKLRLASRREAQQLVRDGRVTVNGRRVTDPLAAVSPERDRIEVDDRPAVPPRWRTIALHKPRGWVTTRRDPAGRPTVFDLLGPEAEGLVAVGRLDLASSGLLLLTTDTRLAERLTNPASGIVRRYVVTVRGELTDADCASMVRGHDGLKASSARIIKRSRRETHLIVELTEGKNREIRRLVDALTRSTAGVKKGSDPGLTPFGVTRLLTPFRVTRLLTEDKNPEIRRLVEAQAQSTADVKKGSDPGLTPLRVTRLLRIAYGAIELGTLQPGQWREITSAEVARL